MDLSATQMKSDGLAHRVELRRVDSRSGKYSVFYAGKLLVAGSRQPEDDAARALHARGLRGRMVVGGDARLVDIAAVATRKAVRDVQAWRGFSALSLDSLKAGAARGRAEALFAAVRS